MQERACWQAIIGVYDLLGSIVSPNQLLVQLWNPCLHGLSALAKILPLGSLIAVLDNDL